MPKGKSLKLSVNERFKILFYFIILTAEIEFVGISQHYRNNHSYKTDVTKILWISYRMIWCC